MLLTRRLALRPVTAADVETLLAHWNDPDVGRYLWDGEPVARETVEEVVRQSELDFAARGFGFWCMRVRGDGDGDGEFAGSCGFRVSPEPSEVELLYSIEPAHWGRGLAAEASVAALHHVFTAAGLSSVVAGFDPPNTASMRVLEKLGMRPWRDLVVEGVAYPYWRLERSDRS